MLTTESIADLRLREHGRARGQKTSEGLLRDAQAGAASAVCQMAICEAASLDEAIQSALSDLPCVDGAEVVRILNPTESSRAHG